MNKTMQTASLFPKEAETETDAESLSGDRGQPTSPTRPTSLHVFLRFNDSLDSHKGFRSRVYIGDVAPSRPLAHHRVVTFFIRVYGPTLNNYISLYMKLHVSTDDQTSLLIILYLEKTMKILPGGGADESKISVEQVK
ncbi:hypothetical protein YC2023_011738 [Brassica napus]